MEGTRNYIPHNRTKLACRPIPGLATKHRLGYYSSLPSLNIENQDSSIHSDPAAVPVSGLTQDPPLHGLTAMDQTLLPGEALPSRSGAITPKKYSYYVPVNTKMNAAWPGPPLSRVNEIPWTQDALHPNLIYSEPVFPRPRSGRQPISPAGNQYAYGDGENAIYEPTQNSDTPLTFSQAQVALNNMVPIEFQMRVDRYHSSGAKSADSVSEFHDRYDSEDSVPDDVRTSNFEKEFQAQIEHQNALLHVIQIEKLNLEGRMQSALRQRKELQDRLRLYRQQAGYPVRNKPSEYYCRPQTMYTDEPTYFNAAQSYMSPGTNPNERMVVPGQRVRQSPAWNIPNISHVNVAPYSGKRLNGVTSESSKWSAPLMDQRGETQVPHLTRRHTHSPYSPRQVAVDFGDSQAKGARQRSRERTAYVPVNQMPCSSSSSTSDHITVKEENVQRYSFPTQASSSISPGPVDGTVQREIFLRQRPTYHRHTKLSESTKENSPSYAFGCISSPSFVGSMCVPINSSPQRRKSPNVRYSMTNIPYGAAEGFKPISEPQATPTSFWMPATSPKPPNAALNGHETLINTQNDKDCRPVRRRNLDPQTRQTRILQSRKPIIPDLYEPGQQNIIENCIPLKETAESTKYYRKQIDILNQENNLQTHKESRKPAVKKKFISENRSISSSPEPVDEEIAEICARDVTQQAVASQRSNPTNGTRRMTHPDPLPVHLEEDTDAEFDMTPVQERHILKGRRQSPTINDPRISTKNVFVYNPGDNKYVRPEFGTVTQRAVSTTRPPEPKSRADVNITKEPKDSALELGQNDQELSEKTDSNPISTRSLSKTEGSLRSPVVMMATSSATSRTNMPIMPVEFDTISSSSETIRVGKQTFGKQEEVKIMCLGPIDGFQLEPKSSGLYRSEEIDSPISPIWIAICSGDLSVSIYDLKTRCQLLNCRDHEQFSRTPVVALLSFVATSNINKTSTDKSLTNNSKAVSGLLCVVQVDGHMTLYNIASRRISGRLASNQKIAQAMLLPHTKILHNCLAQNILLIGCNGAIFCCQWRFSVYTTDHTNVRHPHWEGELHDLCANIYHHLTEDKRVIPFICCICPHQTKSSSGMPISEFGESPTNTSSSKRLQPTNFCLVAATLLKHEDPEAVHLRICSWEPRGQKLIACDKVTKILNLNIACELVGITYAEIAGASSICVCLTTQVYWFNLKSLDLMSTLKLPLCAQPASLLAPVWPQTFSGCATQAPQSERLWTAASTGRLLEISAFESQRRRDAQGRNCLIMLYAVPSDSKITTVTSTLNEKEIVLVGTDKGEIHVIHFPKNYHVCKMPNCPVGLPTADDLLHHVVCDHYLAKPSCFDRSGFQCEWPECDLIPFSSDGPTSAEDLVSHAREHVVNL
ncbi:hypothetical protein CRM22_005762 [Opisthorchis felineus]|uniref:C2H2-type domain-containing protein n=1 Tax=Opisthorchis felineus TaxID=147828 RepID=A0A4S2LPI8_OPIFE|nr:hypothetical protein CRM22_005762 [Opisthorchis felineus]